MSIFCLNKGFFEKKIINLIIVPFNAVGDIPERNQIIRNKRTLSCIKDFFNHFIRTTRKPDTVTSKPDTTIPEEKAPSK